MPASHASDGPASILAVVALYQCELAQSQTVSSLFENLNQYPELARHFSLVLYDNSPLPQLPIETNLFTSYAHDPANGGLASAYNYALARAESEHCEWLLLLDQDTCLTGEFLFELAEAARSQRDTANVAAIVPKLKVRGIVHSPAIPFLQQMRRQFRAAKPPIGDELSGVWPQPLCAYNSGSTLRVSALRSAGGFPAEFWLDFLDHAVYQALLARDYRIYVMRSTLAHDASYADIGSLPLWRMRNVLAAQTLFVKKNGNFVERLLYRVWLLRHSRNLRRACPEQQVWKEAVGQALLFRMPEIVRPIPPASGK